MKETKESENEEGEGVKGTHSFDRVSVSGTRCVCDTSDVQDVFPSTLSPFHFLMYFSPCRGVDEAEMEKEFRSEGRSYSRQWHGTAVGSDLERQANFLKLSSCKLYLSYKTTAASRHL